MALIIFCKCLMMQNRSHVFDCDWVWQQCERNPPVSTCAFICFVYFSPPVCTIMKGWVLKVVNWIIIIPLYPSACGFHSSEGLQGFYKQVWSQCGLCNISQKKKRNWSIEFVANTNLCKEKWKTGILETFFTSKVCNSAPLLWRWL